MSVRHAPTQRQVSQSPAAANVHRHALATQSLAAQLSLLRRRVTRKSPLTTDVGEDIGIVNPWLADYRNNLLKAAEDGANDNRELLTELKKYKNQLDALKRTLEGIQAEDDAARMRTIAELQNELDVEKARAAALVLQLADASRGTEDADERTKRVQEELQRLQGQLEDTEQDLQKAQQGEAELSKQVTRLNGEIIVMESELERLRVDSELADADRAKQIALIEEDLARVRAEQAIKQVEVDEQRVILEAAEVAFRDGLQRNKELLTEMRGQNAALEKEIELLRAGALAVREGAAPSFSDEVPARTANL